MGKVKSLVAGSGFDGEYVATRSFNDRRPIAHGKNPHYVLQEAKLKGHKNPVIIYVPPKNTIMCFAACNNGK